MLELILFAGIIACSLTFIVDYSSVYYWALKKFPRIDVKPLNCSLCMTFWVATVIFLGSWNLEYFFLPYLAGFLQIIISRLVKLIPVSL